MEALKKVNNFIETIKEQDRNLPEYLRIKQKEQMRKTLTEQDKHLPQKQFFEFKVQDMLDHSKKKSLNDYKNINSNQFDMNDLARFNMMQKSYQAELQNIQQIDIKVDTIGQGLNAPKIIPKGVQLSEVSAVKMNNTRLGGPYLPGATMASAQDQNLEQILNSLSPRKEPPVVNVQSLDESVKQKTAFQVQGTIKMVGSPLRNQSMEQQQSAQPRPIFINEQHETQTHADLERDLDRDMNLEKENIPMNKEEETKLLIARAQQDANVLQRKNGVSDHMNMSYTEMLKLK